MGVWHRKTLWLEFPDSTWSKRWGSGRELQYESAVIVLFYQCLSDIDIQQSGWFSSLQTWISVISLSLFSYLARPPHQQSVTSSYFTSHLYLEFFPPLLVFFFSPFLFPNSLYSCCCSSSVARCHNGLRQRTDNRPATRMVCPSQSAHNNGEDKQTWTTWQLLDRFPCNLVHTYIRGSQNIYPLTFPLAPSENKK